MAVPQATIPRFWARSVMVTGWILFVVAAVNPIVLKGGSDAHLIVSGAAVGILLLVGFLYLVGLRTFLKRYDRAQLSWVFTPYVIGSVVAVGLILSIIVLVLAQTNVIRV